MNMLFHSSLSSGVPVVAAAQTWRSGSTIHYGGNDEHRMHVPAMGSPAMGSQSDNMQHAEYGYHPGIVQYVAQSMHHQGVLLALCVTNLPMLMDAYGHDVCEQVMRLLHDELHKSEKLNHDADDISVRVMRLQKDTMLVHIAGMPAQYAAGCIRDIHFRVQDFGYHSDLGAIYILCNISALVLPEYSAHPAHLLDQLYCGLKQCAARRQFTILMNAPDVVIQEKKQDHISRQEMGLSNYLMCAMREERLRMAYQPIVDSKTGAITHYEALLRVVNADGNISSAGALIPIAERMGMIHMVDSLVLDKVVAELRRCDDLVLAFNISNLTTEDDRWLEQLRQHLVDAPYLADQMIVEITETAIYQNLAQTASFVAELQSLGVQVALDDFGAGYTSFRQLKSLSIDLIKIDGAYVRDLVDNADNRFFVKTLVDFTKGFGLKCVAEYVETGEVAKMLMELGVDYLQGYYLGKPETNRRWLKEDK